MRLENLQEKSTFGERKEKGVLKRHFFKNLSTSIDFQEIPNELDPMTNLKSHGKYR